VTNVKFVQGVCKIIVLTNIRYIINDAQMHRQNENLNAFSGQQIKPITTRKFYINYHKQYLLMTLLHNCVV